MTRKTKKDHIALSTVDEDEEGNGEETENKNRKEEQTANEEQVPKWSEMPFEDKCLNVGLIVVPLLAMIPILFLAIWLVVSVWQAQHDDHSTPTPTPLSPEYAYSILAPILNESRSHPNRAQHVFQRAFNIFDQDGDGSLDSIEFDAFFKLHLYVSFAVFDDINTNKQHRDNLHAFDAMDADADGRLCFAECVAYLREMNKIDAVHDVLIQTVSKVVIQHFQI